MAGDLNLALRITALVDGVDKIRDLARAVADASKGQNDGPQKSVTDLGNAADTATPKIIGMNKAVKDTTDSGSKLPPTLDAVAVSLGALNGAVSLAVSGFKFLAGGFLAIKAVDFLKDIADTAARTETLGVVLNTVGKNAGYTSQQLADADKQVQALGITAASSRESLTKLIQTGLDLTFGPKLARAAQDLAVVAGKNSSETLQNLITNIQQMDTQGLRFMGIVINREAVMQKAALDVGHTITGVAQQQVFANAVLTEASKLNGIYEQSLSTVGKQLTSMPRYIEGLKVSLGNNLLPVYLALVQGSITVLKSLNDLAASFNGTTSAASRLHASIEPGSQGFSSLSDAIDGTSHSIAAFFDLIRDNKDTISSLAFYGSAIAGGFVAISAAVTVAETAIALLTSSAVITGVAALVSELALAGEALAGLGGVVAASLGIASAALAPVVLVIAGIVAVLGAAYVGAKLYFDTSSAGNKQQQKDFAASQANVDAYLASLQKQSALQQQAYAAQQAEATLANKLTDAKSKGDVQLIASAQLALKSQQAATDSIGQQMKAEADRAKGLDALLIKAAQEGKLSDDQVKSIQLMNEKAAAQQRATILATQAQQALVDGLKQAGIDFGEFTSGVQTNFQTALNGIALGTKDVETNSKDAATGIRTLIEKLEQLAQQTKTPEELKKFAEALKAVKDASATAVAKGDIAPSQGLQDQTAAAIAAQAKRTSDQAARERAAGGAKALQEANALADAVQASIVAKATAIYDFTKAADDQALAQTAVDYARGLTSTNQYYDQRLTFAKKEAAQELAVEQAKLAELESRQKRATTPEAREVAATAVFTQQQHIRQVALQQETAQLAIINEQETKRQDALRATADLQLKNSVTEDSQNLAAQLEIINRAYLDQIRTQNILQGSEQDLELQREANDKRQAARDANTTVAIQRQLDLTTAQIDQQKNLLDLNVKKGTVSVTEAQNANNDIVAQRIAAVQTQRNAVAQQLQNEQSSIQNNLGGSADQVVTLQAKLRDLDNSMLTLQQNVVTYGDAIRTNFTDSLSSSLDGLLSKGGTLKNFFTSLTNSLRANLTSIISKDLASNATKLLVNSTGGAGNSIFDKLGVQLGDKQRGATPGTPMYVQDVSKIAGAGAGLLKSNALNSADGVGLDVPADGDAGENQTLFGQIKSKISDAASSFGSFISDSLTSLGGSISSILGSLSNSFSSLFSSSEIPADGDGGEGSLFGAFASLFASARGGLMNGVRTAHNTISRPLAALAMAGPIMAFAGGGNVHGKGTGTSDSILSWLSHGEYVVKADAVKQWGTDFMDFVNNPAPAAAPGFADGGATGGKVMGLLRDATSNGGTGGTKIDKLVNNIDARTDTGQVQQLVAQGVREGIKQYDASLKAKGKIK